jgi:hypothetical protein
MKKVKFEGEGEGEFDNRLKKDFKMNGLSFYLSTIQHIENKSIKKQTDLSSRETNRNLLFSTFAFQQPICLSKLNRERYAQVNRPTRFVSFIEINKHSSGLCIT